VWKLLAGRRDYEITHGGNVNKPLRIVIGVDVETDVGSFTPFYEGVIRGVPNLVDLFNARGIEATFFVTGDAAVRNPGVIKGIANSAHEVGCHSLYHETLGDELFPLPGERPVLPEEVPLRIRRATEVVEATCGIRPRSFRCPRLWGSTTVVNVLEDLEYVADASYPMYFYREQLAPYHPARNDWTAQGDLNILEIPNFADMVMESRDPGLERDRDQWPLFRTKGADHVLRKIHSFAAHLRERQMPVVVCLYVHPWEFVPCAASFHFGEATVTPDHFITENCGDYALDQLGILIERLQSLGAEFYRADRLAAEWDGQLSQP
jgi:peptidoglycan/xylan/chitin deacetylase (PgdA/CDA1 family)